MTRLEQLEHSLLLREAPDVEDVGRLRRRADLVRDVHSGRDHANGCARRAPAPRQPGHPTRRSTRRARRSVGPEQPARPPRELDIGAPQLDDERLARGETDETRRQPVGVDEVGVARGPPGSARRTRRGRPAAAGAFHGARRRLPTIPSPYAIPKCRNDAGDTTTTSTPRPAQLFDARRGRRHPRRRPRPRVRGRQDDDLHPARSRGANTAGAATTSSAKTKK